MEFEPLVLEQRPRIITQVGVFFALATAASYGLLSFPLNDYGKGHGAEEEESLGVSLVSCFVFILSLIPAIYLFHNIP